LAYIWSLWLALASPTKAVCTLFAVLSFMIVCMLFLVIYDLCDVGLNLCLGKCLV
jgi:hypothetical protein